MQIDLPEMKDSRYKRSPIHPRDAGFCFPNSDAKIDDCVKIAFSLWGMGVAEIQREFAVWNWVLATDGSLWLHDQSNGCGGYFVLNKR